MKFALLLSLLVISMSLSCQKESVKISQPVKKKVEVTKKEEAPIITGLYKCENVGCDIKSFSGKVFEYGSIRYFSFGKSNFVFNCECCKDVIVFTSHSTLYREGTCGKDLHYMSGSYVLDGETVRVTYESNTLAKYSEATGNYTLTTEAETKKSTLWMRTCGGLVLVDDRYDDTYLGKEVFEKYRSKVKPLL